LLLFSLNVCYGTPTSCAPGARLEFRARTSEKPQSRRHAESAFDPKVTLDDDAFNDRPWTDHSPMITRMVVQTAIWLAAMAAILLLAAGDWGWPQGWVFLGEVAVSTFAVNLWLARHDPALLASRLSVPVQRDQRPWDRTFMLVGLLVFINWLVLCAFDPRRFGWSRVPLCAQVIGAVLIALCMIVVWPVFRINSFAAPRCASDRAAATHDYRRALPYRSPSDVRRCAADVRGHAPAAGLLVGLVVRSARRPWHRYSGGGRGTHATPRARGLRGVHPPRQVQDGSRPLVR
jgi:protein-S-isoprenylcysteine O-methyltransferase Ste14